MSQQAQLLSMYNSGRYQCDLAFYQSLYALARELNLYPHLPAIDNNQQIVILTSELTKKHLHALEDEEDGERRAVEIIGEINANLGRIDTKAIGEVMREIEMLGGKSYTQKLVAYVKMQPWKRIYLEVLDRIVNGVHDEVLRFNDMLLVGLFMHQNGDKLGNFLQIYAIVIENGVTELRKWRANAQFIKANPQISQQTKVTNYIKGTPIILSCLIKFNEIYRLLSGDTKHGLKLNALRKQIFDPKTEIQSSLQRPLPQFKRYLLASQPVPQVCSFCLHTGPQHPQCLATIKLLYQHPKN